MRAFRMRFMAAIGFFAFAVLIRAGATARAQDVTLEVWSHEADEPAKVAFRELAAKNLEKLHPGAKVKITWYEKNPLFAALKTALPAGKGPDVFYLEPDQVEYITAGYTGSLLTSLTHSSGQTMQIGYNSAGRITSVTDPVGRVTQYGYDANNEHLLTVTDFDGEVTTYTYSLGGGAVTDHALLSCSITAAECVGSGARWLPCSG